MDSRYAYDLFRHEVVDIEQPYLWSDLEVYAYMNDAYHMFVRLTGGVPDFTSEVCFLPIKTGQLYAQHDPSILRIRQAFRVSDRVEIRIINSQERDKLTAEDYGRTSALDSLMQPGPVNYMVVGQEEDLVSWIQIPAVDDVCQMLVERLPLATITREGQQFEGVKPHHHLHFLKWMQHLAYNKMDSDSYDPGKSDKKKMEFLEYCELAKREMGIHRHTRAGVSYGGI